MFGEMDNLYQEVVETILLVDLIILINRTVAGFSSNCHRIQFSCFHKEVVLALSQNIMNIALLSVRRWLRLNSQGCLSVSAERPGSLQTEAESRSPLS